MFGLFLVSLLALGCAQPFNIPMPTNSPVIFTQGNPVNMNGANIATRIQALPGGGFRLFDAEDAENIFYPTAPQMPPSRIIHMDAEDLADCYLSPRRLARTSHVRRSLKPVRYGAEDLSNFIPERPTFPGKKPSGPFYIPPRLVPLKGSDSEDLKNEIKWHVTVGNNDEVENGGVNWGEITKIAGQVNEIGHILGFDAEDADDSITVGTACAIIGAACALANTGCNIYSHVKGSDKAEELTNGGINWGEITKIAGQIHDIGKTLGFAAEDLEDKTHWSFSIGNKDEVENGKVNWAEVTKVAGQIYEIGKTLGFGAEDLDDWSISVGVKGTF